MAVAGLPRLPPGRTSRCPGAARRSSASCRARPGRPPSCCCTAGRPAPTSTGSPASPRSPATTGWSRSTTGATAGASARGPASASPTAPTTPRRSSTRSTSRPVIAVGYSMGGPVAQLLWHRHRDKVAGLVLCATTDRFASGTRQGRAWLNGVDAMARMARLTPDVLVRTLSRRVLSGRVVDGPLAEWVRVEVARADPRMLLEAGGAIGRYDARPWISSIDVPTSVVLTEHDNVVAPRSPAPDGRGHPRAPSSSRWRATTRSAPPTPPASCPRCSAPAARSCTAPDPFCVGAAHGSNVLRSTAGRRRGDAASRSARRGCGWCGRSGRTR